jgi:hypothetical protein
MPKNKRNFQKRQQKKKERQHSRAKSRNKKVYDSFGGESNISDFMDDMGVLGTMGPAKAAILYAQPIMNMIGEGGEINDMNDALQISTGLYNAFLMATKNNREKMLFETEQNYKKFKWAKMSFEELVEYMFKRHIYYFPQYHDEEDLTKYTKEEIEQAIKLEESPKLPPEEYKIPETFNLEYIKSAITDEDKNRMEACKQKFDKIKRFIKGEDTDIVFEKNEDESDVYRNDCIAFQSELISHFARYLNLCGMKSEAIDTHCNNIDQFANFFLVEYTDSTLLDISSLDSIDEFVLDFFFRKVTVSPAGEDILIDSLIDFYRFLESAGYITNSNLYTTRFLQCLKKYKKILEMYRRKL